MMMLRRRVAPTDPSDEGIHLVDILDMLRESPEPPAPAPAPPVNGLLLPRAPHQILAPIPGGPPGSCEQAVPEGLPMPPGAAQMHSLTVELLDALARRTQWEMRDQRIIDARRRVDELDHMEAEIHAQRDRAEERIAELEAMEPVEPVDWGRTARQILRVTGFRPMPQATLPAGLSERNLASPEVVHSVFGEPRFGRGSR